MATGELTRCPKCGRMVPPAKCVCGYQIGFIRWNQGTLELALKQGWQVLKCPPTPACPTGVSILTHPDKTCVNSYCRSYPLKHRHRADDIEEIVIVDEDKPGEGR